MRNGFYTSPAWKQLRVLALERDDRSCTVARLIGGPCSPRLDVHHLRPISEGGDPLDLDGVITVCSAHHPRLEALRRYVLRDPDAVPPCNHIHPYPGGREACARLRARRRAA